MACSCSKKKQIQTLHLGSNIQVIISALGLMVK